MRKEDSIRRWHEDELSSKIIQTKLLKACRKNRMNEDTNAKEKE